MKRIINKIKDNSVDRIVEVFWVAIKAAVIAAIILLLLQIIPIRVGVSQTGYRWDVGVGQSDHVWSISY